MDLPEEDGPCRNRHIGRKRDDAPVRHADVDGTIHSTEGEGTERSGCGEGASSEESFDGTGGGAAIERETVAVVAGFGGGADAITTAMQGAIGMTEGLGSQSIEAAVITFLSRFDGAIATGGTQESAGRRIATVGESGVVEPRLTDFIESLLDNAITTDATLEETGGGAAVTVTAVAVIAFLGGREDAVTAGGGSKDFCGESAGGRTEVARGITLLGSNSEAITTGDGGCEE